MIQVADWRKVCKVAAIAACAVGGFSAVSLAADKYILSRVFKRYTSDPGAAYARYDFFRGVYGRVPYSFFSGKTRLQGYLYGEENEEREGGAKGLVVFCHGLWCDHQDYLPVIVSLVDRGWKVFAYDGTGCGESGGHNTRGLSQSALDMDAALSFCEQMGRFGGLPMVSVGHSWGGYGVCAALNFPHDVKAVVSFSGYEDPLTMYFENTRPYLGTPLAFTQLPFISLIERATIGPFAHLSALDGINATDIPVLVCHGVEDDVIGYEGASLIAAAEDMTNPNVRFHTFSAHGRSGHNSYFYRAGARDAYNDTGRMRQVVEESLLPKIGKPSESDEPPTREEIAAANLLDMDLIDMVDRFLEDALGS